MFCFTSEVISVTFVSPANQPRKVYPVLVGSSGKKTAPFFGISAVLYVAPSSIKVTEYVMLSASGGVGRSSSVPLPIRYTVKPTPIIKNAASDMISHFFITVILR